MAYEDPVFALRPVRRGRQRINDQFAAILKSNVRGAMRPAVTENQDRAWSLDNA